MRVFRAAILTAKEVEFDAVRQHLIDEHRVDDTFDGTVYRKAKIRRKIGADDFFDHWDVAVYRTGRGQQPTTYGTQILIQHFRPDIVLYVGVAGGDPSHKELSVGDVIVGKLVRYYERSSQYEDHFTIKDNYHSPDRALINAAEYEADDVGWLNRVVGNRPNSQVFVEEIASGEKVQKSSRSVLWGTIKARYPDVVAVETEGHGFHYAVSQSAGRAVMVRSISDLLDNKDDDRSSVGSDDERQALASRHAAAFAINLIVNLNTKFLEEAKEHATFRYAVILKISVDNLEGVHRVTRLLADAINDPNLRVESLQPANSFLLRISTNLHSAAYTRAIFRGDFISTLLGAVVTGLESDVERTGDEVFDEFLAAVADGDAQRILAAEIVLFDFFPSWRRAALTLERVVLLRGRRSSVATQDVSELSEISEVDHLIVKLNEISKRSGLTIKELARLSGVSSTTMSRFLKGTLQPSLSFTGRLQRLIGFFDDEQPKLGLRVQELRKKRALSQSRLAGLLGVNVRTLARVENGARPSSQMSRKLAEVFASDS